MPYLKIEILPFDEGIWENTFQIDFDAIDDQSGRTYRERINEQAAMLNILLGHTPETETTAGTDQTTGVEGETDG